VSSRPTPQQKLQTATIPVCLGSIHLSSTNHRLPCALPHRAIYPERTTPRKFGHQPSGRHHSHASYQPQSHPSTSDRLATLSGPCHAFCCPATCQHRLFHRPIYKYHGHEFCCLPMNRYKYFHRTKHKHPHRVSDPFYTGPRRLTSLTKSLCLFHLEGHPPTYLRTCSH